ncbi:hypothetical protein FNV43_RR18576 [Rhamnella rubrinervis]|uniref:Uncharacterized protein n=1 Tax=Rhamnella rubrinervis TaxID=2594499 RepID=A0A8K0GT23_9ROSA|nr:hypothetical protein FNV43_RR18576 [Rhamnella rubrinervis]
MEKTERTRGSPKKLMKTSLCIPRLRSNTCTHKNRGLSPMALLERFREAVFRLIMLSALSKATTGQSGSAETQRQCYYYPNDPRHSEAVADCIEFIKKTALQDENRDSSASASSTSTSIDATPADVVMPVTVI